MPQVRPRAPERCAPWALAPSPRLACETPPRIIATHPSVCMYVAWESRQHAGSVVSLWYLVALAVSTHLSRDLTAPDGPVDHAPDSSVDTPNYANFSMPPVAIPACLYYIFTVDCNIIYRVWSGQPGPRAVAWRRTREHDTAHTRGLYVSTVKQLGSRKLWLCAARMNPYAILLSTHYAIGIAR